MEDKKTHVVKSLKARPKVDKSPYSHPDAVKEKKAMDKRDDRIYWNIVDSYGGMYEKKKRKKKRRQRK